MANEPLGVGECNSVTAAKLIKVTIQWLNSLVKAGWIKKVGRDRFKVVEVVHGYVDYLQDENRKATKTQAATRVQDARAREIELRTARESGKLIDVEDVESLLTEVIGELRSEFSGLPAACTRDLEMRGVIEKNLNDAIDRARRGFENATKSARAGGPLIVEGEEPDA